MRSYKREAKRAQTGNTASTTHTISNRLMSDEQVAWRTILWQSDKVDLVFPSCLLIFWGVFFAFLYNSFLSDTDFFIWALGISQTQSQYYFEIFLTIETIIFYLIFWHLNTLEFLISVVKLFDYVMKSNIIKTSYLEQWILQICSSLLWFLAFFLSCGSFIFLFDWINLCFSTWWILKCLKRLLVLNLATFMSYLETLAFA